MSSFVTPEAQYTSHLPDSLYAAGQVRELDCIAIKEMGVPGFTLMTRAGEAAYALLREKWPDYNAIQVFCGVGNNGGDGYIVASLAQRDGLGVQVIQVGDTAKLKGDARTAYLQAADDQVEMCRVDEFVAYQGSVIVDALLGTGLGREVRGDYRIAVDTINAAENPVLALDLPSGLCSDTGCELGRAVKADAVLTFIGVKQGLFTAAGPEKAGKVYFAHLGVSEAVCKKVDSTVKRITKEAMAPTFQPRPRDAHKGHFGHVMVIGGDYGMGGAVAMAAEAAARSGAGLVSAVTRPEHMPPVLSRSPEVMVHGVLEGDRIDSLVKKATVIVVGPGLGQGKWGESLLQQVLESELPMVVDADGLNYLTRLGAGESARNNWVLTPHPGEASRLLNISTSEIQKNRFQAALEVQKKFSGTVVLKGAGTLITNGRETLLADVGNPGMASGGMGDVLGGVIGGLVAQGFPLFEAAGAAAWVHGKAADRAARDHGERGLLASDLMVYIRQLVNMIDW